MRPGGALVLLLVVGSCFKLGSSVDCPAPIDHGHYEPVFVPDPVPSGSSRPTGCQSGHYDCSLVCDPGWKECRRYECTSLSAASSCGECGRACKQCFDGSCQPVRVVATGKHPAHPIVYGDWLLWRDEGQLLRAPVRGGEPEVFRSSGVKVGPVVDATGLYWVERDAQGEANLVHWVDGIGLRVLARATTHASGFSFWNEADAIAVDAVDVFHVGRAEEPDGGPSRGRVTILATAKNGSGTRLVAEVETERDFAAPLVVGGGWVYVRVQVGLGLPRLLRVPVGGGTPEVVEEQVYQLFVADGEAVWFASSKELARRTHAGTREPLGTAPWGMTMNEEAYFLHQGSTVWRHERAGGARVALAGLQKSPGLDATSTVVVDGSDLFWIADGEIHAAKTTLAP